MKKKEVKKILAVLLISLFSLAVITFLDKNRIAGFDRAINVIKALAGIGTFIIAILLFDRFGLRKDLKSRQFDLVISVAEVVKGMSVRVKSTDLIYIVNFTPNRSEAFINSLRSEQYNIDKSKKLVVDPNDYKEGLEKLLDFQKETLLPEKIELAINEFHYVGYTNLTHDSYHTDEYLFVSFKGKAKPSERELGLLLSEMNFEEFNNISEKLASAIQKWILEHSEDEIDIFSHK